MMDAPSKEEKKPILADPKARAGIRVNYRNENSNNNSSNKWHNRNIVTIVIIVI